MLSALFSGVSGMRNHLVRMNVVGHNISNVNTIGFKGSRVTFAEMMSQTIRAAAAPRDEIGGTNPVEYGLGMTVCSIDTDLGQGGLELTGQVTDLAIQGDGYFMLSDGSKEYYTRAGNFIFDADGNLVAPGTGLIVQGRMADSNGEISSGATIGNIWVPFGRRVPGGATTTVAYTANLDAATSAEVEDGSHAVANLFARGDANSYLSGAVDGSTTITVNWGGTPQTYTYVASDTGGTQDDFTTLNDLIAEITNDFANLGVSLLSTGEVQFTNNSGAAATLTITSTDTDLQAALAAANGSIAAGASNTTDTFYYTDEDDMHSTSITVYDSQGDTHTATMNFVKLKDNTWFWEATLAGSEIITAGNTGTMTFNSNGSLGLVTYDGGATAFEFDPNNGADTVRIALDFGTESGFDGVTQFAAPTNLIASGQDGYGMGILSGISIDSAGIITGKFSNGVNKNLAQIILADFSNSAGLSRVGDSLFEATGNSGPPLRGVAGLTVNGSISSGYLEMSNVDLGREFVNMIVTQRGFQANARIITATDDLLTELVNLSR